MRNRLIQIIREKSFSDDREITLASGKKSFIYFNLKPTMLNAEGGHLLSELLAERVLDLSPDYVAGMEMGGVPLVALASSGTYRRQPDRAVDAIFIRKAAKEHGTGQRIEGLSASQSISGKRVLMLEDTTTTGGSIIEAIKVVRDAGARCDVVVSVIDRQEGAEAALAEIGVTLTSLLRASDFTSKK